VCQLRLIDATIRRWQHSAADVVHCKNIRISTVILWRVFHILKEPVPHKFVSVNRRNNEVPVVWASLFRRFTDTNVYGTGNVKIRITRHKISADMRIFLQCTRTVSTTQSHVGSPARGGCQRDRVVEN